MTAKSQIEILGFEYDWLAADGEGHVAIFTTAGGSYAPEEFLRDTDEHRRAIGAALAMPSSTVAVFAPELPPGYKNTWLDMAERGFYGFDGDPCGDPYRKVAAPRRPVRVEELRPDIATVVRRLVLPNLSFAKLDRVSSEEIGS
jgi:hypothetical protein